jgi:hypothetical protein
LLITKPSITLPLLIMSEATFNFLVDTLVEEVRMHPYRDELIRLIEEQLADDNMDALVCA